MLRRRRSMWRRLRLGQRRRRSRGGHQMRRYRRSMRRRQRLVQRRRESHGGHPMRRYRRSMRRRQRSREVTGDCGVGISPQVCKGPIRLGVATRVSTPAAADSRVRVMPEHPYCIYTTSFDRRNPKLRCTAQCSRWIQRRRSIRVLPW